MNEILNISGVECYEQDGTAYLKLETVARGLGFTRVAASGNEVVRWETVRKYLSELGVPTCWHEDSQLVGKDGLPDFIPENVFYRLAMKAKNETAEKFQAKIADEVIPSIRKHGAYMTPEVIEQAILNPDFIMKLAQKLKEEMEARKQAETALREQSEKLAQMRAALTEEKARSEAMTNTAALYAGLFEAESLSEERLKTSMRETAKLLCVPERLFIDWLLAANYLYRGRRDTLLPRADKEKAGLFEVKHFYDHVRGCGGIQTVVTAKGRELIRRQLRRDLEKVRKSANVQN